MRKIRLLLADDHPVVRVGLRTLLETEPDVEVVGEASTGAEAVSLVALHHPDVVVMDISMPEMDGLEATHRVRELYPPVHVLILTVHAQERYLFPVLKAGASGYVLKLIPMPDYRAELMPELMPQVVERLMPHLIGEAVPLVAQPLIDYLHDAARN